MNEAGDSNPFAPPPEPGERVPTPPAASAPGFYGGQSTAGAGAPAAPNRSATAAVGPGAPGTFPARPSTNVSAIIAFVMSLLGIIPVVSIIAVILGHRALIAVGRTGEAGGGLARAALVMGYLGILGWAILIVFTTSFGIASTAA